jgi:hypothetical protein
VDKYIYDETKGYFIGLPARDITADEWKELPEELTKAALKAKLYKLSKKSNEVKDA